MKGGWNLQKPHIMARPQPTSPSPLPARFWPTRLIWGTLFSTIVIGGGLPLWDAFHNRTPDTHPLQTDRLVFRIIGLFFMVLAFAMVGMITYLVHRPLARLRKGLCPMCGYDLRVQLEGTADSDALAPS